MWRIFSIVSFHFDTYIVFQTVFEVKGTVSYLGDEKSVWKTQRAEYGAIDGYKAFFYIINLRKI